MILLAFNYSYLSAGSPLRSMYTVAARSATVWDRTRSQDASIDMISELIPVDKNISLEEASNARIEELLKLNKPIALHYSGGIDSAYVLCELLKRDIKPHIITTVSAMNECYSLAKIIANTLTIGFAGHWDNNYVHVFGSGAEGAVDNDEVKKIGQQFGYEYLYTPITIQKVLRVIECVAYSPHPRSKKYEAAVMLLDSIDRAPFKIDTVQKLLWWLEFNWGYHNAKYSRYLWTDSNNANAESFFTSTEFQQYSMRANAESKEMDDFLHKMPLKKAVADFIKDDNFLYRTKSASAQYVQSFRKSALAVTTTQEHIYALSK
jgi:hypothetical protein